ncbi:MAG: ATP-binding protein [Planctomycetota bacterium]|jgi:PAS domain S-box-containing protein
MIFIWFIYGLAFFALGLAIFAYPKKGSMFKLAKYIWLIAGFGFLHGVNEWLDMFISIGEPFPPDVLKIVRMITLTGSFLFLLRFGTKVIVETQKKLHFLELLPVVLFAIWVFILIISRQRLLVGDISARYLLCAPGTFLTSLALFLQIPQFKKTKLQGIVWNLQLTAITFLLYGILAGLIVKKAPFFGANFLNYDMFFSIFGAPVQIFRAVCAVILACSMAYVLSIFRWETEQALYRSEQRFGTIASTMPIILFVEDNNSIITFIQGRGMDILGLKANEVVGSNFSQVLPSVSQIDEDCRRAFSGEEFSTTVTIEDFVFEFCYSPISDRDGKVTGIIGVALDITSRVQAQRELVKYSREMEKSMWLAEVGTLSSSIAQELNEPLSVTQLLIQRILTDLNEITHDDTIDNSLKKSLSEVSKASEIVNRFQSIAQVSSKTTAEPVDLYQITKRIMAVFAQSAKRAHLTISVKDIDVIPSLSIPTHQLEQIFFILVQKAIDSADINKHQKLTISYHHEDKGPELRFSDTCGGIEPSRLQHIFDPFFVAEPDARQSDLGLAVAKRIICDYGGEIIAESRPGQGTTFHVKLPIEQVD